MVKRDSFERLAAGLSESEKQDILSRMQSASQETAPLQPVDERLEDNPEPIEQKIKNESLLLRIYIFIKAILTNTTKEVIYNEHKLSEISRYINRNFPGFINAKNGLLLTPFYERLYELKNCADFFKPYFVSDEANEGSFYVFLSTLIMPEVNEDIRTNADPYSNPVTAIIRPDTRTTLLRKLEDIFENIPAQDKAKMYEAAKASEWFRQFIRLPFARFIMQFTSTGNEYICPFSQIENEIEKFVSVLCGTLAIPDEFLEALYLFAIRSSKLLTEDAGRDAGEFLVKAHSNLAVLQLFMTSIPIRSIGCLVHGKSQWRAQIFSGGEDWFVKYKNTWKKIFEQKWQAWESDCKREALLSTLKAAFDIDSFPKFPERPWENIWGGISFAYESTLGFLNWFMKEKFPACEFDLKALLIQGTFNKKENHAQLSDGFNAMIQISISFQELTRRLSPRGEAGSTLIRLQDEHKRTLQAQAKVDQLMTSLENDVATLIHRFGDAARSLTQVLNGILTKDNRFDTISNLSKLRDQKNEPFVRKVEESKNLFEHALNFVTELEILDKQKSK